MVRCVILLIVCHAVQVFHNPLAMKYRQGPLISPSAVYLSFPAIIMTACTKQGERSVWNNDVRHRRWSGGKIMWEKTNLLALHNFHSEAEYQTKKKNMRLEGNTVFSYILNTNSVWKGAGEGRENTQEREAAGGMWGRTLKEWVKGIHG